MEESSLAMSIVAVCTGLCLLGWLAARNSLRSLSPIVLPVDTLVLLVIAVVAAAAYAEVSGWTPGSAAWSAGGQQPASSEPGARMVEVDARRGWQATGVMVETGRQLTLQALGGGWTANRSGQPTTSGEGWDYVCTEFLAPSLCVEPVPNAPQGALIGRIGRQAFSIGRELRLAATTSGLLELRMNDGDDGLHDNDGVLQVLIVLE